MIRLYIQEEFDNAKSNDKLSCQCIVCGKSFFSLKKYIVIAQTRTSTDRKIIYCSRSCQGTHAKKQKNMNCSWCQKNVIISLSEYKKSKTGNVFCSRSCAAKYNNTHKAKGTKVSKLEVWLQNKLQEKYPNLEFHFNRKDTINSELDIFIPSLKVAFELNGIFHYEPIFGEEKLQQIQNNDLKKFQACLETGIKLCIIDTNSMKNFKEQMAKPFFDIICDVIEKFSLL